MTPKFTTISLIKVYTLPTLPGIGQRAWHGLLDSKQVEPSTSMMIPGLYTTKQLIIFRFQLYSRDFP